MYKFSYIYRETFDQPLAKILFYTTTDIEKRYNLIDLGYLATYVTEVTAKLNTYPDLEYITVHNKRVYYEKVTQVFATTIVTIRAYHLYVARAIVFQPAYVDYTLPLKPRGWDCGYGGSRIKFFKCKLLLVFLVSLCLAYFFYTVNLTLFGVYVLYICTIIYANKLNHFFQIQLRSGKPNSYFNMTTRERCLLCDSDDYKNRTNYQNIYRHYKHLR
jgi:hypothetical protein